VRETALRCRSAIDIWTLDIFRRLRRPLCGKALPFRGLPLLLFLAATPPIVDLRSTWARSRGQTFETHYTNRWREASREAHACCLAANQSGLRSFLQTYCPETVAKPFELITLLLLVEFISLVIPVEPMFLSPFTDPGPALKATASRPDLFHHQTVKSDCDKTRLHRSRVHRNTIKTSSGLYQTISPALSSVTRRILT